MRTLAIGDIHGCLNAFEDLINQIDLQPGDTLITLGDYIDRGPDSKGVIDLLIELSKKCNLITLLGNHEDLMFKAFNDERNMSMWLNVGGVNTLNSYLVGEEIDFPPEHLEFYNSCALYHETDTHIFVHGGLQPELDIEDQDIEDLLWLRFNDLKPHKSKKIVVCGHTPQRDHSITDKGHAICIDTHAFADGYLTCLDIESGKTWQSSENAMV